MTEFDIGYPHSNSKRVVKKGLRTIHNRMRAFELGKDYYDGGRNDGYGGFKYDGRWQKIIPTIIERYNLNNNSAVLEVGCKKGFFLHDIKQTLPEIKICGIENHRYPLENAMESVKENLIFGEYSRLPFKENEFDFILGFACIYMQNLRGVMSTLREIERVGKGNSYITVGAYRTPQEKELFELWTLIGTAVYHVDEWIEIFKETKFSGDYSFVTAETLNLVGE